MCKFHDPSIIGSRDTEGVRGAPPPQSKERMGFSVLGSLITVPLHSTLAVNNLGLKFVS